jgi:ABC-2 type transport system permease protein
MAKLVRAELSRLVTRRFTQLMVVLLVGAFAVALLTTMGISHRPTASELAGAQAVANEERANTERLYEQCRLSKRPDAPAELRLRFQETGCGTFDPRNVGPEDFLPGVFSFTDDMPALVYFLSAFLTLFGFLVGASFVGAELTSGGMTNLLLWRPQRLPVLGAKLGTVLAGTAVLAVGATLVYLGSFWALAEVSGLPGQQTGQFWGDLAVVCLRGIGLALVATTIGFTVATVGRHTSAAVGLAAAYAVVWEVGARLVMEIGSTDHPGQWVLSSYIGAWMAGSLDLGDFPEPLVIQWWHAGILFAVLLAFAVATSFTLFRRRDLA